VFFLSTHEWGIYPGTGAMEEIGEGPGRGYNLNVPLPEGAGDSAFERIAEEIIAPAAQRFKPELLLVSAGFDAHWADPLANLQLSVIGYARLMRVLLAIADRYCGGKIALMLEGGYDLEVLGGSVPAVIRVLLGDSETHDPIGLAPQSEPDIQSLCRRIRDLHHL
jgi:acetoin utilization deacetylase AcuC-like enzyme